MRVESSDGVIVAVHDLGGTGAPILLSHATGLHGRAYDPMAERLAAHRHVYALDYRGHGDATAPTNGNFDWAGMADDLEAVIPELTSEPLDLFGHSMGGAVAILVELRRPGTLRSAYLFEPIIVPTLGSVPSDPDGQNPMAAAARRRRPTFPSRAEAMFRYARRPPMNALQAGSLAAYVEHGFKDEPDGTVRLKCAPEHEAATFEATGKATIHHARHVTTPTVVSVGRDEGSWSPSMFGPAIVDAMPNARLERHPDLGHFGPLQDPDRIAAAILASLS